MFFSIYFAMTGMHALHMIIGLGLMAYLIMASGRGKFGQHLLHPSGKHRLYCTLPLPDAMMRYAIRPRPMIMCRACMPVIAK